MAKTTRVLMPQLGESVHEGTISKWLVKPGDKVVEFEPMLEVDTDKVNAEVPAPVTGILREILAKEGETVQAGAEIAVVEVGGDGPDTSNGAATPPPEAPAPTVAAAKAAAGGKPAPVVAAPPAEAEARPAAAVVAVPSSLRVEGQGEGLKLETPPAPKLDSGEHRYSPAVQMQASELKVDLAKVVGTGIGGRLTNNARPEYAPPPKTAPVPPAPTAAGEPEHAPPLAPARRPAPH